MRIIKDGIKEEDKQIALDILNKLRAEERTFGSPAEGLHKTLAKLNESAPAEDSFDSTSYNLKDQEYEKQVSKLKAGIKGEEELSEYFEKLLRLNTKLSDMVVFASLGDTDTDKDYIPDTDFLCIYGKDIMIVDAKNLKVKKDIPIFVKGDGIYSATKQDEPLIEVHSSVPVWKDILAKDYGGEVGSINGCVCIINKTGIEVYKNDAWENSDIKPIHIAELESFLEEWIKDKEPVYDLKMLVAIAKQQIQKENDTGLDLSDAKRIFEV